jgi:hypothetical protein
LGATGVLASAELGTWPGGRWSSSGFYQHGGARTRVAFVGPAPWPLNLRLEFASAWPVPVDSGHDRNLQSQLAVQNSIDYIHQNSVRRKLCQKARDWRWSSARFYESEGREVDPLHPVLTFLPYEFWL